MLSKGSKYGGGRQMRSQLRLDRRHGPEANNHGTDGAGADASSKRNSSGTQQTIGGSGEVTQQRVAYEALTGEATSESVSLGRSFLGRGRNIFALYTVIGQFARLRDFLKSKRLLRLFWLD